MNPSSTSHHPGESAGRPVTQSPSDADWDGTVLSTVLAEPTIPLWGIGELKREIGKDAQVEDSIKRLIGAGLLHRLDDFVFPTVTARRIEQLTL